MSLGNKPDRKKVGFLGMRVIKTSVAVYLCFLFSLIRGSSPLHSTFAAIISMKTDHKDGIVAGKERILGTCLGGIFGLFIIVLIEALNIDPMSHLAYLIYSLTLIPIIYTNIHLNAAETVSLSTIVFISIALSTREISPLYRVLDRLIETLIGVIVSIVVNLIL